MLKKNNSIKDLIIDVETKNSLNLINDLKKQFGLKGFKLEQAVKYLNKSSGTIKKVIHFGIKNLKLVKVGQSRSTKYIFK